MCYYKARIYSPTLGRFLQTDPIGYADGLNWYNYVGSDPVNATDPSGLCGRWGRYLDENGVEQSEWIVLKCPGEGGGGGYFLGLFRSGPVDDSGALGGGGGVYSAMNDPKVIVCPTVTTKITGVGPNQATTSNPTSISQTPGNAIPNGSVAIDPADFGVPNARGAARAVLGRIKIYPVWLGAVKPSNGAPAIPQGLPSQGPYTVVDVIGPASSRDKPGFHIDLYRYSNQKDALASTRVVPTVPVIPVNSVGVTCPTGQ